MSSKTSGCLIALLVLALVVSLGLNLGQVMGKMDIDWGDGVIHPTAHPKKKLSETTVQEAAKTTRDKIVHIDLDGIISSMEVSGFFAEAMPSVDSIKDALEQASKDKDVKAIVLRINSPGGEVTASDILYNAVKKAAKEKPVVVYMDAMAASGGYYVSCGATKIVASETTLTASIGVIIETLSYHELFGKVGLGMQTFTSGAFKDSLNGARPMRDDEKAYVQNLVTQMYDRFLGIVSEARGVPKDQLKNVADGRVVTGRQALEAKLVDQIGYVEDAYALARELGKAPDAGVVKYRREVSFFDVFAAAKAKQGQQAKVQLDVGGGLLPKLMPGVPYYLPSTYAH
ncbi:MAG: signal peptide peptidase SppA [Prosthecobacter sp.]|jgi:protease-4|uniref:signal peptide peptidase SppA n=1 Tax=Prosthecobacter sp. TaxID=1965333 RepID=UPI0019FF9985|nr:signal peptide peptidase SppA [Prosthecobacter sp.]MBE2282963.1 signal peptide peptidase SppA [Prosthecobacter sp.]